MLLFYVLRKGSSCELAYTSRLLKKALLESTFIFTFELHRHSPLEVFDEVQPQISGLLLQSEST